MLFVFRWVLLVSLGLLAGATALAQAAARPVVLENGGTVPLEGQALYWVGPAGVKTPEELERPGAGINWKVREAGQQHRLEGEALWIRFDADVRGDEAWFFNIASSGIDRVQMFHRADDGRWVVQEAGDSRAVSQWPVPGRVPTFELARPTGRPVTYWVRIEHARVDFGAELTLRSQDSLLAVREREQFLMGGYFGVAALLALVALANAVTYRDRNFAAYAIYLISFTLGQAAYLGVGRSTSGTTTCSGTPCPRSCCRGSRRWPRCGSCRWSRSPRASRACSTRSCGA